MPAAGQRARRRASALRRRERSFAAEAPHAQVDGAGHFSSSSLHGSSVSSSGGGSSSRSRRRNSTRTAGPTSLAPCVQQRGRQLRWRQLWWRSPVLIHLRHTLIANSSRSDRRSRRSRHHAHHPALWRLRRLLLRRGGCEIGRLLARKPRGGDSAQRRERSAPLRAGLHAGRARGGGCGWRAVAVGLVDLCREELRAAARVEVHRAQRAARLERHRRRRVGAALARVLPEIQLRVGRGKRAGTR